MSGKQMVRPFGYRPFSYRPFGYQTYKSPLTRWAVNRMPTVYVTQIEPHTPTGIFTVLIEAKLYSQVTGYRVNSQFTTKEHWTLRQFIQQKRKWDNYIGYIVFCVKHH